MSGSPAEWSSIRTRPLMPRCSPIVGPARSVSSRSSLPRRRAAVSRWPVSAGSRAAAVRPRLRYQASGASISAILRPSARSSMSRRAYSTSTPSGTLPRSLHVRDRAALGALGELGVLGENAARVARVRQLPIRLTPVELGVVDEEVERVAGGVDHDPVAVLDERDRSPVDGFGRDVPDAVAVRATREPAVGHERGIRAPTRALHRARHGEHLPHPAAALRALVADHHDVAGVDPPADYRVHRRVLAVEHAGGAFEAVAVEPGDLHDRALRR